MCKLLHNDGATQSIKSFREAIFPMLNVNSVRTFCRATGITLGSYSNAQRSDSIPLSWAFTLYERFNINPLFTIYGSEFPPYAVGTNKKPEERPCDI